MVSSKDWFMPLLFFKTIFLVNSFGVVLKGGELARYRAFSYFVANIICCSHAGFISTYKLDMKYLLQYRDDVRIKFSIMKIIDI